MLRIDGLKDLNEVFEYVVDQLLWNYEEAVDFAKLPSIFSYTNLVTARTCDFDFDLGEVGLQSQRWARFMTQYAKKSELKKWFDSMAEQNRAIVNLFRTDGETKVVPNPKRLDDEGGHRWGVCFLGVAFRRSPKPQLTLYSRMGRLPTTATMELNFVHQAAKEIKQRYGIENISFAWYADGLHIHSYDVVPFLINRDWLGRLRESGNPLYRTVGRYVERIEASPHLSKEDFPFAKMRRFAIRAVQARDGTLPSNKLEELDLWRGRRD